MPHVAVTAAQLLPYLTPRTPLPQITLGEWCLGARSHCEALHFMSALPRCGAMRNWPRASIWGTLSA